MGAVAVDTAIVLRAHVVLVFLLLPERDCPVRFDHAHPGLPVPRSKNRDRCAATAYCLDWWCMRCASEICLIYKSTLHRAWAIARLTWIAHCRRWSAPQ